MAVIATVWPVSKLAAALPALRQIRPHAVMLHDPPAELARRAPEAARVLRADRALQRAGAPPDVWLCSASVGYGAASRALAALRPGDEAGRAKILAQLLAGRLRSVEVAKAVGASALMWNCEWSWKRRTPGFDGAAAVELINAARAAGAPRQLVTSYGFAGGGKRFPYDAFDCADGLAPQIYAAKVGAKDTAGRYAYKLHRDWWLELEQRGRIRTRPYVHYGQAHSVQTDEACWIAGMDDECAFWALPTRCDADGIRAARAMVLIEDSGFAGPGRIARWQAANGLKADGLVGPKSLAKLGLV